MLGSASLQSIRKGPATPSVRRSRRSITVSAVNADPNAGAHPSCQLQLSRVGVATSLSTLAAVQLVTANLAWADVPEEALISLQAAEPLTEISEAGEPAAVEVEVVEAPSILIDAASDSANPAAPEPEPVLMAAATEDAAPAIEVAAASTSAALTGEESAAAVAEVPPAPEVEPEPEAVYAAAEPAVASEVIAMDIPAMPAINPDTDIKTLVAALIRNEQFIAALVNNEAFLDRLAGEDRVVQELARRKGLSIEVEARDELATELRRRATMMDALAARGEEAVLAVADAAKQAAEDAARAARSETKEADVTGEVGVVSSGRSALVALGTAVELLEDSQELLEAVESNPSSTPLSALADDDRQLQREFKKMEAAVARAEQSVSRTLEKTGAEPLQEIQGAVRELYTEAEAGAAGEAGSDPVTITRAYTDLVTAVAEMQKAYGTAISKAVGHAVSEVVEVEEAALQGAEKTKQLVGQKVEEVNKVMGLGASRPAIKVAAPAASGNATGEVAEKDTKEFTAGLLRAAVIGAFVFWLLGTFVHPRSRYSR